MSICQFCGQPSTLLCDGRIYEMASGSFRVPAGFPNGKTRSCDALMCRQCAKKVTDVHMRTSKGCRWDTIDLCPECTKVTDKPIRIECSALQSANAGKSQPTLDSSEERQQQS